MTSPLPELAGVPDRLWERVASASHRILFLDYDGTLASFHVDRDKARAGQEILGRVRDIASTPDTSVAIVSGRPLADLTHHLGPMPIILVGEHGWEVLQPGGRIEQYPLSPEHLAGLESAFQAAQREEWRARIERKRAALVLHTRGLPGEEEQKLLHAADLAWGDLARGSGMRLDRIDGGIELRAAGRDKGSAVRDITAVCPSGAFAVYVGDDATDEDAFREVEAHGFGILVGSAARVSRATGRLPTTQAVGWFLERWLAVVPRSPAV